MRHLVVQNGGQQILNSGLHVSETDNPLCGCCDSGCQKQSCILLPHPDTLTVTVPAFVQGGIANALCDACPTIAGQYVLSRVTAGQGPGALLWRYVQENFCTWLGYGCAFNPQFEDCAGQPIETMRLRIDVTVTCNVPTAGGVACQTFADVSVEGTTYGCCFSGGSYRWTVPITYPAPATALEQTVTNPIESRWNFLQGIPCDLGPDDSLTIALGGVPASGSVGAMAMPLKTPDCQSEMRRGKPVIPKGKKKG